MMAPGPKKRRSEAKQEAMEQKKGTSKRLRKERSEAGQLTNEWLGRKRRWEPSERAKEGAEAKD